MNMKNAEFLDIFILMSISNFMLSLVEHEKRLITLGPCLVVVAVDFLVTSALTRFNTGHFLTYFPI